MSGLPDWSEHTAFSDPGPYAALLGDLPDDVETLAQAARNVIVHYRAQLPEFTEERVPEINSRWMRQILERDQTRFAAPLLGERPLAERVAGCCRDHSLFLTSALREHGVAARNRVGFATYLIPEWAIDHVITEYCVGDRWIRTDAEFRAGSEDFDPRDMGTGLDSPFHTAAEAWLGHRSGTFDLSRHAVFPGAEGELAGAALVRRYVLMQTAHRYGDEMLLWDAWGAAAPDGDPLSDNELDEIARLLVAADGVETSEAQAAERALYERYLSDARLRPGETVMQYSPLDGSCSTVSLERPSGDAA